MWLPSAASLRLQYLTVYSLLLLILIALLTGLLENGCSKRGYAQYCTKYCTPIWEDRVGAWYMVLYYQCSDLSRPPSPSPPHLPRPHRISLLNSPSSPFSSRSSSELDRRQTTNKIPAPLIPNKQIPRQESKAEPLFKLSSSPKPELSKPPIFSSSSWTDARQVGDFWPS